MNDKVMKLPADLELWDNLRMAALEYHSKPMPFTQSDGSPGMLLTEFGHPDQTLFRLRDSIIYRADCAAYHINPLSSVIASYTRRLREHSWRIKDVDPLFIHHLSNEALYVFDDILFNVVSLLDYASSFLAYPYLKSDALNLKWNAFRNNCNPKSKKKANKKNRSISDAAFSQAVEQAHNLFVEPIQRYRAAIYHNHKDFAPCGSKTSIGDSSKSYVWIGCPKELAKAFERKTADYPIFLKDKLDLVEVCQWLVDESNRIVNELVWLFRADVNALNQEHFKKIASRERKPNG